MYVSFFNLISILLLAFFINSIMAIKTSPPNIPATEFNIVPNDN